MREEKKDLIYIVDKKNRVVVCNLLNCTYIAADRIEKYCTLMVPYDSFKYYIDEVYTGIARCSPEDEWDEEFGKKLALKRAKKKRCSAVNNMIIKFCNDMQRGIQKLIMYGYHKPINMEEEL